MSVQLLHLLLAILLVIHHNLVMVSEDAVALVCQLVGPQLLLNDRVARGCLAGRDGRRLLTTYIFRREVVHLHETLIHANVVTATAWSVLRAHALIVRVASNVNRLLTVGLILAKVETRALVRWRLPRLILAALPSVRLG